MLCREWIMLVGLVKTQSVTVGEEKPHLVLAVALSKEEKLLGAVGSSATLTLIDSVFDDGLITGTSRERIYMVRHLHCENRTEIAGWFIQERPAWSEKQASRNQ